MSQDDQLTYRTYTEHAQPSVARNSADPVLARFGPYMPLPLFYVELLPELKPSDVLVLLVILRQTLGWTDKETGSRKEREWISQSLLARRTGLNRETVGIATKRLFEFGIIRIENETGYALASAKERRRNQARTYYRPMPPELP